MSLSAGVLLAFPPHLVAAPTSRRSYQREPSPGDSRSPRRFSHSRGRPLAKVDSNGSSRGRSVSFGESTSRDRADSESDFGSKAPLFRKREGVESGGPVEAKEPVKKRDRRESLTPILAHFLGFRNSPVAVKSILRFLSPRNESIILAFFGSFVSILIACAVTMALSVRFDGLQLAIGSLGATAVLLYAAPAAPLSQPRNAIGGHIISAVIGICVRKLFELYPGWTTMDFASSISFSSLTAVAYALAVALSILVMQLTNTLHPPVFPVSGGATALIAVFSPAAHWAYLLGVLFSVTAMVLWACIVGNLGRNKYPMFWWATTPPTATLPVLAPAPTSTVAESSEESPDRTREREKALEVLGEEDEDEEDEERGRKTTR
ncbi:CBS domain-containing membrane protein, partial [Phenoliferia sp. Uapishka_3]